ncbi:MAG: hypothetical protein MZV70_44945 [Desulfobacterales bacterium]|nr:hypothetical protein [Desulfobacterales bacterium]
MARACSRSCSWDSLPSEIRSSGWLRAGSARSSSSPGLLDHLHHGDADLRPHFPAVLSVSSRHRVRRREDPCHRDIDCAGRPRRHGRRQPHRRVAAQCPRHPFRASPGARSATSWKRSSLVIGDIGMLSASPSAPVPSRASGVGLSTVKGLAFATGKPVVAVPTLEAFAWHLPFCTVHHVCPLLDARGGEVYAAVFEWNGDGFGPGMTR